MDPRITQLIIAQRLQEDIQAAERGRLAAAAKRRPKTEPTARPRRFVRRPRTSTLPGR
jgi:hypothetical protein